MRIDNNNVLRMYENTQKTTKNDNAASIGTKDMAAKTDRVLISPRAAQSASVMKAVQGDASEIENSASLERMEGLTQQIEEGAYLVPSDELAKAILDTIG